MPGKVSQTAVMALRARLSAPALLAGLLLTPCALAAAEADCVIRPSETVNIGAPVTGLIAEVRRDRGDRVAEGEVIARLDDTLQAMAVRAAETRLESDAEIEAAQSRVGLLEAQLTRQQALLAREVISAATMAETETSLLIAINELRAARQNRLLAEVDLETAMAERERRRIRAPVDGVVLERGMAVGEFWSETAVLMTIARLDPLHVEAIVDLSLHGQITADQMAMVLPEAPVGGSHAARVSVVDPVIDAASGTFGVRLVLPNPDMALPAGLRCTVRFEAG